MDSQEEINVDFDPFNLGKNRTLGEKANVLIDGPIQLYDQDPTDFTVMDTPESETQRDDDQSLEFFSFGDENLGHEEFTPFDELMFPPNSDDLVILDSSQGSSSANVELDIIPGSLLDHSLQSTQIHAQPHPIPHPIPQPPALTAAQKPRTGRSPRNYPSTPSSFDDQEFDSSEYKWPTHRSDKSPTQRTKAPTITKRRDGHIPGINRQTGQPTLIGQFPPLLLGPSLYACPTCWSPMPENPANVQWRTRNGYKYHLKEVCLGNPNSKQSIQRRIAEEAGLELPALARKKDFRMQCGECAAWFRSEAGYRSHRETNVTTRHGLCRTKGARGSGLAENQDGASAPVVEMGVPQMDETVLQVMQQTFEFDANGYFAWRNAWMASHGNAENWMREEPQAQAQLEAVE